MVAVANTGLQFGVSHADSLQSPGEVDTYTFTGNAGDTVYLSLVRASGIFWPKATIISPGGTEILSEYSTSGDVNSVVKLTESGTYTLMVLDRYDGSKAGPYTVTVQSVKTPGNAQVIQPGALVSSSLGTAGEADSYTFQAVAGDDSYFRYVRTSDIFWPKLLVFSPSGIKIIDEYSTSGCTEINEKLTETGNYVVIVKDRYDGSQTGSYGLFMQKTPGQGNAREIVSGSSMTGSLEPAGEVDSYRFTAATGDTVKLHMNRVTGIFWPKIVLLSPSGTEVCSEYSTSGNLEISVKLTESGTYTILAQDRYDGSETGTYSLTMNRISGGGTVPALSATSQNTQAATTNPTQTPGSSTAPGTGTGDVNNGQINAMPIELLLLAGGVVVLIGIVALAGVLFFSVSRKKAAPAQKEVVMPPIVRNTSSTHDVFISYASENKPIADAVCATMEARKIRCWIAPRDIRPGTNYAEGIIKGIEGSRVLVLVFSSFADKSPHVMREVERAVSLGIPIITFRIEDVMPSLEMKYYIGPIHWLDAISKPIEAHINKLSETVEFLLKQSENR